MEIVYAVVVGAGAALVLRYLLPGRDTYGIALLPALGAAVTAAVWAGMSWLGFDFDSGWGWLWLASLGAAVVVSLVVGLLVGRTRERHDARQLHILSGGNQQKVVVARELSRDLRLLVAAQPTRGVDVGSIEFIHKQVVATRDSGIPVLVVSTELDEVVALADRIMVLYRGRIVGIVPADTPRQTLGLMMTGERPDDLKDVVA